MRPETNLCAAPGDPLLLVLLGPTGSGKTTLSLQLAERFGGEIISCDSVAVYQGMDVGSAKPSAAERARVPHHLLDVASPDQPYTAGDYSRAARHAAHAIAARGNLPIVTGGTGLYLRAMLQGLFPGPPRSDALRQRLAAFARKHGEGALHRLLSRLDKPSAERIHPHDEPKLIRALEVVLSTRQQLSASLASATARDPLRGFRTLRLGLAPPRAALYERLNRRAAQMFASPGGLLEETESLLARYGPHAAALGALGYREAAAVLRGELPLPEAVRRVQQGHRNYAKRQLTWFRQEPDVCWLEGFGEEPALAQAAERAVSGSLRTIQPSAP